MEDMDFQNFTFFVYRLTLEAQDRIELVRMNRGITLRGAFGTVFRRLVCHDLKAQCGPSCPLHSSCPYGFIFAPTVPADAARLRLNRDIPRPFVIKPPLDGDGTYKPGDHLVFDLVVIGRAQDFLPYFIVTFEEMGRQGIGIRRGRYKLGSLESLRRDGSWQKVFHREDRMVTPPAGAWIETRGAKAPRLRVRVAPCAGVWSVPRMDRDGVRESKMASSQMSGDLYNKLGSSGVRAGKAPQEEMGAKACQTIKRVLIRRQHRDTLLRNQSL